MDRDAARTAVHIARRVGHLLLLIVAGGAAGMRRLNPFVTTCAAIALVSWVGSTAAARAIDGAIGGGLTVLCVGGAMRSVGARARRTRIPPAVARPHARLAGRHAARRGLRTVRALECVRSDAARSRRRHGPTSPIVLLLALGAAMLWTGAAAATARAAVGVPRLRRGPRSGTARRLALATETWLILCGLVALAAGVALERYLRTPRNGLTSAPLTTREGPLDLLQIAGAALLAKRAGPEAPPAESTFEGGGGKFGGGGASGSY